MKLAAEKVVVENTDMSGFEAQFDDGGNGGFDNGSDVSQGEGLPDKPGPDFVRIGAFTGGITGIVVGKLSMDKADHIMMSKQTVAYTSPPGVMGPLGVDYKTGVSQGLEAGVFFAPVIALAALGALIGGEFQKRRYEK